VVPRTIHSLLPLARPLADLKGETRKRERGFNGDETQLLQNLYRANAFPTLIVVSARTGMMTRVQGFLGADETVAWIRESVRALR